MEEYYDYIVSKPELNEDTLAHYGVKGMKWRKHKAKTAAARFRYEPPGANIGNAVGNSVIDAGNGIRNVLLKNSPGFRKFWKYWNMPLSDLAKEGGNKVKNSITTIKAKAKGEEIPGGGGHSRSNASSSSAGSNSSNRPVSRKKKVTTNGKGVSKRGSALGTGKVGR